MNSDVLFSPNNTIIKNYTWKAIDNEKTRDKYRRDKTKES